MNGFHYLLVIYFIESTATGTTTTATVIEAKPRVNASILSNAQQAPGRIVRVLQAHKSTPTAIATASTSTPSITKPPTIVVNPSGSTRSRKVSKIVKSNFAVKTPNFHIPFFSLTASFCYIKDFRG